ncbi:MAG: Dabb family protein [Planctomycetota bacterium]|nr:Dabb family protein [Planctomycetota bacterium]
MPQLSHAVYFTLRDRTPEAAARLVAACREHLTGHPGTVYFSAGTRAPEYDREVNDREHDVALVIVFESHAAHDAYQDAERHRRFIAENATGWAQVRVFDADLA